MKILSHRRKGFVGKNPCAQLNALKEGKDHRFRDLAVDEVLNTTSTPLRRSLTDTVLRPISCSTSPE